MSAERTGRSTALVAGGSKGLGLSITKELVTRGLQVSVIGRDPAALAAVAETLGVRTFRGNVGDEIFAKATLKQVQPNIVILNAGTVPPMGPIHTMSWNDFSAVWDTDVKAGLLWIQAILAEPLPSGSRVLLTSSGAALAGSPLSGGYAGAKRMLWFMAGYANGVSEDLGLGIKFQALLPHQIVGGTGVGDIAAQAYAGKRGVGTAEFLASFGEPLLPLYGKQVADMLENPAMSNATAFTFNGNSGIRRIDA